MASAKFREMCDSKDYRVYKTHTHWWSVPYTVCFHGDLVAVCFTKRGAHRVIRQHRCGGRQRSDYWEGEIVHQEEP